MSNTQVQRRARLSTQTDAQYKVIADTISQRPDSVTTDDLTWLPAWRIRELIGNKEVSPVEVAEHFLHRIVEFQPALGAFRNVDPDEIVLQAEHAEAAVMSGEELGPLHGVPVSVKHHIDIAGMQRAGMPFWSGVAERDDLTVQRLRGAGATIMGHNVMSELRDDGGYNWRALPRNPWDPARVPGVSTAGGGAAVAAGLVPIALGSDGAGSCRLPAAYTGVFGLHPTAGSVPWVDHMRWAVRPGTTIGPLSRDARDAATALSVIAGPDGRDQLGLQIELPDPRRDLDKGAAGLRLAWSDDLGFASAYAVDESPRVVSHIREAAFALGGIGADIELSAESWEDYVAAMNIHRTVFSDMPILGPEAGLAVSQADWDSASDLRHRNWQRFRTLFATHDLLLCPTQQSVAPTLQEWSDRWSPTSTVDGSPGLDRYAIYTAMFNWLGFPAMSVPCGFIDGLPVGLQIIGPPGADARILRLASAFQHAFPRDERPSVS